MIEIVIPPCEEYDEEKEEFVYPVEKPVTLQLEHSLISISKWESKWHEYYLEGPFSKPKTEEQTLDYIRCMTLTKGVNPEVYKHIPPSEVLKVKAYIQDPMTATKIPAQSVGSGNHVGTGEMISSELIYYWMIAYEIPFSCEKWHLNRLITLIRVCQVKQEKPKPMPRNSVYARNSSLNAARRAKHRTKG